MNLIKSLTCWFINTDISNFIHFTSLNPINCDKELVRQEESLKPQASVSDDGGIIAALATALRTIKQLFTSPTALRKET